MGYKIKKLTSYTPGSSNVWYKLAMENSAIDTNTGLIYSCWSQSDGLCVAITDPKDKKIIYKTTIGIDGVQYIKTTFKNNIFHIIVNTYNYDYYYISLDSDHNILFEYIGNFENHELFFTNIVVDDNNYIYFVVPVITDFGLEDPNKPGFYLQKYGKYYLIYRDNSEWHQKAINYDENYLKVLFNDLPPLFAGDFQRDPKSLHRWYRYGYNGEIYTITLSPQRWQPDSYLTHCHFGYYDRSRTMRSKATYYNVGTLLIFPNNRDDIVGIVINAGWTDGTEPRYEITQAGTIIQERQIDPNKPPIAYRLYVLRSYRAVEYPYLLRTGFSEPKYETDLQYGLSIYYEEPTGKKWSAMNASFFRGRSTYYKQGEWILPISGNRWLVYEAQNDGYTSEGELMIVYDHGSYVYDGGIVWKVYNYRTHFCSCWKALDYTYDELYPYIDERFSFAPFGNRYAKSVTSISQDYQMILTNINNLNERYDMRTGGILSFNLSQMTSDDLPKHFYISIYNNTYLNPSTSLSIRLPIGYYITPNRERTCENTIELIKDGDYFVAVLSNCITCIRDGQNYDYIPKSCLKFDINGNVYKQLNIYDNSYSLEYPLGYKILLDENYYYIAYLNNYWGFKIKRYDKNFDNSISTTIQGDYIGEMILHWRFNQENNLILLMCTNDILSTAELTKNLETIKIKEKFVELSKLTSIHHYEQFYNQHIPRKKQ